MVMAAQRQGMVKLWGERIEAWKVSGKNIAQWCRENKVPYIRFFYWRNRLSKEQGIVLNSSKPVPQFIELTESPQILSANSGITTSPQLLSVTSGVSLSFQEMHIHLSRDFDRDTLLKCLHTLKAL
jgi:hypothetical protein